MRKIIIEAGIFKRLVVARFNRKLEAAYAEGYTTTYPCGEPHIERAYWPFPGVIIWAVVFKDIRPITVIQ